MLSVCLQMLNYKRATLDEEEVSDVPAEAASSPDRVEVSECSTEWDGGGSCLIGLVIDCECLCFLCVSGRFQERWC